MEEVVILLMHQPFFANKDVDGGLIGGASLKADDFVKIAMSFE